MLRTFVLTLVCLLCLTFLTADVSAQQAYGRNWATADSQNWQRFYYYPYVYYPHNYYTQEYYQSSGDLYNRYPAEMRVPAYNKQWINFYPTTRRYHQGNHFRLDIF
ncbi:hypothetical protein FACS189419_07570 [Planctomycetales bacterium]|nr:hypothetical protein FACS189419_07570 [Planctomycetales bacterium]